MTQPSATAAPVLNSEFLRALAHGAPNGTTLWVTSFVGSPDLTDARNWHGRPYSPASMLSTVDRWTTENTYFSVAALRPTADGELRRRKANFSRLLVLVADDVQLEDVQGQVSYVLETSPGKTQVGIFIDRACEDAANMAVVDRLVTTMAERGLLRADLSGNNAVRYVRLPLGQNQKPRDSGAWSHRMLRWAPDVVLSLDDAAAAFGMDLATLKIEAKPGGVADVAAGAQDERLRVLTANVIRGDGLHDSLNQIAASLVATGMPGGAIVNMLRALMESSHAAKDERWLARYQDIPRAVTTAQEKFARRPIEAEDAAPSALPFLSLTQLRATSQSIRWAVKHVIPADSVGVMFGGSGTFKSFIALDFALHVAHGMPWLGRKTKRGAVLFIAAEGGAGLWRRVEAWHQAKGLRWDAIEFYVVPVAVALVKEAARVVEAASGANVAPAVVIVDTMSQTFDGEENSANEVAAYLRELGARFRALWHCVVLVIHHSGHQATERPRGSSAIRGNVDFMLGVFRDEKEMLATVECHKQKDGELFDDTAFGLASHRLGADEDGEAITSLVAAALTSPDALLAAVRAEKQAGRGGHNALFLSLAQTGVTEIEMRAAFYRELAGVADEAKKKAFKRASEYAQANGFIDWGTESGRGKRTLIVRKDL